MAQNIVQEERHMSLADLLPLLCLAFTAFIFNTSEFIPVGLLTDIASSFALTEAQTGMMISIYAWGVMILSVPLMVFASRYDYRRILLGVVGIFLIGQIGSALAPTFALLIAARLIVASAHAVFWSVATPAASQIAGPKYSSLALSMVASGSSVAMVLGMPLGRAIGLALGWRMTFTSVAIASFVALIGLTATVPKMEKGEPFRVRALPQLFRNPALAALYIMTILGATGYYVGYSYIEPFLQQIGVPFCQSHYDCTHCVWLSGYLWKHSILPLLRQSPCTVYSCCARGSCCSIALACNSIFWLCSCSYYLCTLGHQCNLLQYIFPVGSYPRHTTRCFSCCHGYLLRTF